MAASPSPAASPARRSDESGAALPCPGFLGTIPVRSRCNPSPRESDHDACRAHREDRRPEAPEEAVVARDRRQDGAGLAGLLYGGAAWSNEAVARGGRGGGQGARPRRRRCRAAAGSALSRLVADGGADRSDDLPLLRAFA